jgi:ribosome biogenesis protein NSA2
MPQNNYIEQHLKKVGKRPDAANIVRKKTARDIVKKSHLAKTTRGIKAKMLNKKNFSEKIKMKKAIKAHEEKKVDVKVDDVKDGSKPAYLLDREEVNRSKILSNTIKQKRKEKAGRWSVPIERVKALTEAEMFNVKKSGKRQKKAWKRVINKLTFVPENFVRKPPKYEKYIRPSSLRFRKCHVTHPELKTTFYLDIVGVKRNPQSSLYTGLGVITKGTILEVNVAELGLVTTTGKVVWSKYAQVTNVPENDGCINSVLLV